MKLNSESEIESFGGDDKPLNCTTSQLDLYDTPQQSLSRREHLEFSDSLMPMSNLDVKDETLDESSEAFDSGIAALAMEVSSGLSALALQDPPRKEYPVQDVIDRHSPNTVSKSTFFRSTAECFTESLSTSSDDRRLSFTEQVEMSSVADSSSYAANKDALKYQSDNLTDSFFNSPPSDSSLHKDQHQEPFKVESVNYQELEVVNNEACPAVVEDDDTSTQMFTPNSHSR